MELVIVGIEVLTHLKFYITGIICGYFVSSEVFVFLYRHIIGKFTVTNDTYSGNRRINVGA